MNKFYRSADKKNILLNLVALDGEKEIGLESLKANTSDGAAEKHVPVVSVDGNRVEVSVGSVSHPMLEEHYITGIYIETKAVFLLGDGDEFIAAYEYCNLHGLWKAE